MAAKFPAPMACDKGAEAGHLKPKRRRKGKEKQVVSGTAEADHLASGAAVKKVDDTWDWATLASSSSSNQPCLFTKDGR